MVQLRVIFIPTSTLDNSRDTYIDNVGLVLTIMNVMENMFDVFKTDATLIKFTLALTSSKMSNLM